MGVNNKTISVTEINKQLIAVRTASKIEKKDLVIGEEFNASEVFNTIVDDLKTQKIVNHLLLVE